MHTAASTLASLATLSLSPPKSSDIPGREGQPDFANSEADARLEGMGVSVSLPRDGKKGAIFKCETCSKARITRLPTRTGLIQFLALSSPILLGQAPLGALPALA